MMQAVPICDDPRPPENGTCNRWSERTSVRQQAGHDLSVTPGDGVALGMAAIGNHPLSAYMHLADRGTIAAEDPAINDVVRLRAREDRFAGIEHDEIVRG